MRVVVTGATGFVGSHAAVGLARAGHVVVAASRDPGKLPALAQLEGIRLARLDLSAPATFRASLRGADALVHVALGWGDTGPELVARDTAGAVALFEAALRAGVRRVIYTSSTAALGELDPCTDELRQHRPETLYGAAKAAAEMFARAYSRAGLAVNVVRPSYTFGEPVLPGARAQPDRRIAEICRAVQEGRTLALVRNDGTQFLDVGDLVRVYTRLLEHPARFSVHHAAPREWISWEQVAHWAGLEAGREARLDLVERGWAAEPYRFDASRLERELGLAFESTDRLRAHVRWELGRARDLLAHEVAAEPGATDQPAAG